LDEKSFNTLKSSGSDYKKPKKSEKMIIEKPKN
jgi:hypothetical protein